MHDEDNLNQEATENEGVSNETVSEEDEWDKVKWERDPDDEGFEEEEESEDGSKDEADQQTEEPSDESETETDPEAETHEEDQWIELKHFDEVKKVGKEEAKSLAQKGMDYDRIREERDGLKAKVPRYEAMEKFMNEMKGDFGTIEEFMDDTRARIKAENEGSSYEDALQSIKSARAEAEKPKESPVDEFVKRYPNVKAEDIPASVWAEVRETGNLVSAYEKHVESEKDKRITALEQEIATLKNNKKNEARSTGSMKTRGVTSGKSTIASLWDDGE